MSDPQRALVTGGAGFIGSHLTASLLERGMQVRVLDDLSAGDRANLEGLETDFVEGSVRDVAAVMAAMQGVDWVFHLAAEVSVPRSSKDPGSCYETNLNGSLNILRAGLDSDVKRVVLASSAAVYGESELTVDETADTEPNSPYAASKLAMETAARMFYERHGLPTVALRLFNVYGPRQAVDSAYSAVIPAFVTAGLAGAPATIYGDGSQQRDFIYVGDVVRAFILAAECEPATGGVYNIASGSPLRIDSLARILQDLAGEDRDPINAPPRPGDISFSHADIQAAKDSLGFEPVIGIHDGLQLTVEWFRLNQPPGAL